MPITPEEALGAPKWQRAPFRFENVERNAALREQGQAPKVMKTGTTIVGVVYKDGVVLGADTRAGAGTTVADKNCQKLHPIAPNMYAGGAGTSADCDQVATMAEKSLAVHRFTTGKMSRGCHAETILRNHLYRYQGYVSAYYVLGGVDVDGPFLYSIAAYGTTMRQPFVSDGSGGLAAMAVLERRYRDDLTEEEAKEIAADAISAGQRNDCGSGGYVDLCVIKSTEPGKVDVDYLRPYRKTHERITESRAPDLPKGATPILSEKVEQAFEVKMEVDK
eukprot:TRINITY_DN42953_c0_g1_i1.p2 TRINITY_DN42953_c0_g1~~TRINITY_DN42953_c0_g1_i1.p2  ORF type:complete len:277 (+),score=77.23 TRINITY_DN42953_c0_g1_i1:62-892(+)